MERGSVGESVVRVVVDLWRFVVWMVAFGWFLVVLGETYLVVQVDRTV